MLIGRDKQWMLYIGRDDYRDARLTVFVGFGYREEAKPPEVAWRRYWEWSSASLPYFVRRDGKIIGICAFGRCRVWR